MKFVGVDLAWSLSGGTGLCCIENGHVIASTRVSSDDEIVEWLRPHVESDVLVAIDAPLILRNETGRRPCEQLISRCFGAQHASTHSANLGLPAFAGGVRAESLALTLGLDVDPEFEPRTSVRRAIEVYPHPAIVALFDHPVTLKYKAKPGRSSESRIAELSSLVHLMEGLVDAEPALEVRSAPRWEALKSAVSEPRSMSDLSRVEDEIDAVVCAYIALYYWWHGTERCRVAGDTVHGYIVTPVNDVHAACIDRLVSEQGVSSLPASPRVASEAQIVEEFCRWLESEGWTVEQEVGFIDVCARRGSETLCVEAKGSTAATGLDTDTAYGQLLRRITDDEPGRRYGLVLPESRVEAALRVPAHVRRLLRIDVYGVGEDGTVFTH